MDLVTSFAFVRGAEDVPPALYKDILLPFLIQGANYNQLFNRLAEKALEAFIHAEWANNEIQRNQALIRLEDWKKLGQMDINKVLYGV